MLFFGFFAEKQKRKDISIMKKLISITLAALLLCLCGMTVFATEESLPTVRVSISDENGDLVLAYAEIGFYDYDGDGVTTINDALICAHNAKYEGGASAGYASAETQYGLSLTKLWGAETGSYGYYVNNASAWSLADEIKSGDHIKAFVYTDNVNFSDTYSFFKQNTMDISVNDTVTLDLTKLVYDENWNLVTKPVAGADILVNGEKIGVKTDENGVATFAVKAGGDVIVSAVSEEENLVPPVCIIHSDASIYVAMTVLAVLAIAVIAVVTVIVLKKKQKNA